MKRTLYMILALAPLWGLAQDKVYRLTVRLRGLTDLSKAYLVTSLGWSNQHVLDSAMENREGFYFRGQAAAPQKVQLVIDHAGTGLASLGGDRKADYLVLYLEPGRIVVAGEDSIRRATVSGSALNAEYAQYHAKVLAPAERASRGIDAAFLSAPAAERSKPFFLDSLRGRMLLIFRERDSLQYVYIREHPDSWLSLEALKELAGKDKDMDVGRIEPLFRELSDRLRGSGKGKELERVIDAAKALAIGAMAPDFVQDDVEGRPVRLSDFRGEYVLVDFWASWCGPCRRENPNVLKAYSMWKDKRFTVLGVSLDAKKEAWLAAIKADGLPWTQVSDLQAWKNAAARLYDVSAIPQNFLVDPSGKIVAKNLRGDALEAKLKELL